MYISFTEMSIINKESLRRLWFMPSFYSYLAIPGFPK